MATLKDVSILAQVSTASVSKVLNGNYTGVTEQTKKRILEAAKTLKYRPNRIARGLAKRETSIIGIVVPDISNPYFAELVKGMENEAELNGYNIFLCDADYKYLKERKYVNMLIEYNVCGVVLIGMESSDKGSAASLSHYNIPFVTIDRLEDESSVSFTSNSQYGSKLGTEYLIEMGHRSIAFIGGENEVHKPNYRKRGYIEALNNNAIEVKCELICNGSYNMESGYYYTKDLISMGYSFTAIVCGNDLIAFGAIKAIKENNLEVPRDFSLIGYDDILLASFYEPKLTTIRQDSYELGRNVMNELLMLLKNNNKQKIFYNVEPKLIIRDTVRKIN